MALFTTPASSTYAVGWNFANTSATGLNASLSLGAIHYQLAAGSSTSNLSIGNNSGTDGTVTLNGATLGGVANVILANTSTPQSTLTITRAILGTSNTTTLRLGSGFGPSTQAVVLAGTGVGNAFGRSVVVNTDITEATAGSGIKFFGGGDATNRGGSLTLGRTNSFTGGLTIGNADGTGSGRVRLALASSLPTTGDMTVNPNSQLRLDAMTGTYGSGSQTLFLNSLGAAAGSTTAINPGGLRYEPGVGVYAATFNPTVSLTGDGGIHVENTSGTNTLALAGAITSGGGFGVTKTGGGVLALTAASTYAGATNVAEGTVRLDAGGSLSLNTAVSLGQATSNTRGTFDLNGQNQTIAGLNSVTGTSGGSGTNTVTSTDPATLTVSGSASSSFGSASPQNSGVITGAISLVKDGAGTLTLGDANTYTGTTTVDGGTLRVTGSLLKITAATAQVTVTDGGTLAGTLIQRDVVVNSGGTIAPGASPGTMTADDVTFAANGNYVWQLYDASAGPGTGYDTVTATSLNITATNTTGSKFKILLESLSSINPDTQGPPFMFDETAAQSFILVSTTDGIDNFAADKFEIDTTNFTIGGGPVSASLFSVALSGNNLVLNFNPVPEPGSILGVAAAGVGVAGWTRRRRAAAE